MEKLNSDSLIKIKKKSDLLSKFRKNSKLLPNENMIPTFICLLLTIVLIFALIMQVDSYLSSVSQARKELESNNIHKAEIDSNTQKIANGNYDEKDAYVEKKLIELLSVEELTKLTKGYWNYQLFINNVAVKSTDALISVRSGDVKITITEKEGLRVLPVNIHAMGMVTSGDKSDSFYDHILFDANVKYSLDKSKKDNVNTAVYTVKDVKAGQKFVITLSEPLVERLNLNSADITISAK